MICVTLAACGGAGATNTSSQLGGGAGISQPPDASGSTAPTGSGAGPVTGHVGDKLTFAKLGGDPVDATLVKVFDPATPNDASEAPLPSGSHWVGFEVTVDNHVDYSGEGSSFDAVTSAGTAASDSAGGATIGDGFAGCTQTPGDPQDVETYTFCVPFVVPDGQTIVTVGIRTGGAELALGQVTADQATWTVP
jgi:hypothetical protein